MKPRPFANHAHGTGWNRTTDTTAFNRLLYLAELLFLVRPDYPEDHPVP